MTARGSGAVRPTTNWLKRSACQVTTCGKLGRERAGDAAREPVVAGHRRDVEGDERRRARGAARHEAEELARRQVEGHVRLAVGVDEDQVVALAAAAQEGPRVGGDDGEARVVAEAEVAAADGADAPGRSRRRRCAPRVVDAEGARRRAAGVAEDRRRGARGRPRSGGAVRNMSHSPPVSTVSARQTEWMARPSLRYSRRSAAELHHLDELVPRLLLVDEPGLRLDDAGRDGEQRRAAATPASDPAAAQQRRGGQRQHGRRRRAWCAACRSSGMVTSAGTNVPMRLPAVESAKTRPATRPASSTPVVASRMANGVTMPSSTTGGANSTSDAANEPTTAPVESASMPRTERSRNGRATKGMAATSTRGGEHEPAEQPRRRAAVGEAAAEPVAQRERREDEADDVGPHHGRRAVVGRQQARGADLGGHRADAGEEDTSGQQETRASGGGVVVEVTGLEPVTFWLPAKRSPN